MHIVYRIIREEENPAIGLWARSGSEQTVEDHVFHGENPSSWISMTCSISAAIKYNLSKSDKYGICRIVAIDIDELDTAIEDCRNQTGWRSYSAYNYGNASQELCVYGYIPERAILGMVFGHKEIDKINEPISDTDVSVLKSMGIRNVSDFLPETFIAKYNKMNDGMDVIEGGLTKDIYHWNKDMQIKGIRESDNLIKKISEILDKTVLDCIENGKLNKAVETISVITKIIYNIEQYIQKEFNDIDFDENKPYDYKIPNVQLEIAREYKETDKIINLRQYQKEADQYFDAMRVPERKRINFKTYLDEPDIVAIMSEQAIINALQKEFGGQVYKNGTRLVASADINKMAAKVKNIFTAEKELEEAAEIYTQAVKDSVFTHKINQGKLKELKENYQLACMEYNEQIGKSNNVIPKDYWKTCPEI